MVYVQFACYSRLDIKALNKYLRITMSNITIRTSISAHFATNTNFQFSTIDHQFHLILLLITFQVAPFTCKYCTCKHNTWQIFSSMFSLALQNFIPLDFHCCILCSFNLPLNIYYYSYVYVFTKSFAFQTTPPW